MKSQWNRGTLKEAFLSLPEGCTVFVIRTKLHHTSLGPTYWIMSVSKSVIYQVCESHSGANLCRLVKTERPALNQTVLDEKAKSLLQNSTYRKHSKDLSHLFVRRKSDDTINNHVFSLERILRSA